MVKFTVILAWLLISNWCLAASTSESTSSLKGGITVYVAKKIITMEPSMPEATAVAVADGRIVGGGSLDTLKPWISTYNADIDDTFKDKVLMPGFIDPHLHPSLLAVLGQVPFLAPDDWSLPTGEFPGVKTKEAYIERLKEMVSAHYADQKRDPDVPFLTWGYHALWHGELSRAELDELFPDQPVIIWQRSFHELFLNTAALKFGEVKESTFKDNHEVDWNKGHFMELGARQLLNNHPKLHFFLQPKRFERGLKVFTDAVHEAGITSILDMGIGVLIPSAAEIVAVNKAFAPNSVPARVVLTPLLVDFVARGVTPEDAVKEAEKGAKTNNDKVMFDKHFKIHIDGAAFSGLGQMGFPGYIDGHKGVWMGSYEEMYSYVEAFWKAGYQIHSHTNGDESTAWFIKMVKQAQAKYPRTDHRTTLEHFMYATEDQLQQMGSMGMAVSANPYYNYILSDLYAKKWLGEDRARNITPLGSARRAGVKIGLHSDSPMAPLSPLTLVWTAVNRVTMDGNKNYDTQKLTVHEALRAITIDAAWIMRWENKVGSIRAGKNADFTVLEQDPYHVDPRHLKDIKIWGTIFEGKKFPISIRKGR